MRRKRENGEREDHRADERRATAEKARAREGPPIDGVRACALPCQRAQRKYEAEENSRSPHARTWSESRRKNRILRKGVD